MEKKHEKGLHLELPIKDVKYSQNIEEMKIVIDFLMERMKSCPSDDIVFNLVETVEYYSLKRNFKLKTKSEKNDSDSINKFINNFLTDISCLETFIVIPTINQLELETKSSKGNKFKSPKVYDINGDEVDLENNGNKEIIIFLFDNLNDLNAFISRNKNTNLTVFCLCINQNFFETKKCIKNSGLLNNSKFYFYFTDICMKDINRDTNLKLKNFPRIAYIENGVIKEDKCIKNVNIFELQRDLIDNMAGKGNKIDEQAKIDKFIYLENENKKNVVKSMNIYLKKNGLNDVHFFVKSKICIDKKGIKKTRCYPVIYGETSKEGRNMIENLITILNDQDLFFEIQCKVNYKEK